jgi:IclR family KDG regulon transcriptional repressor
MAHINTTVQAVANALEILEFLSTTTECGVSDLARTLGCQKSTVFRLLSTLKETGYITQDGSSEKYSLSLKLFKIGSRVVNDLDLNKSALPIITRLAQTTSETVHLCALDNDQLVYLQKIESTYSLKVTMMSRIGQGTPFYCTGVGKVLLAWQDSERIQAYLRSVNMESYTESTITDPLALASELQKVRIAGIAYDREEHELGVRCIAAPIFNQQGMVIAALSVSGPTVRMTDKQMESIRELVKDSAFEISAKMGFVAGK